MILYVNGDSHCVGHGINKECGMTHEDPRYELIKQAPHPENFMDSFGYQIAENLKLPLICQAASGSSIDRCLRVTKQFVFQTNKNIFLLLGLPALNREEWYYQNKWWQITRGDADRYPAELHTRFKNWLIKHDTAEYKLQRVNTVTKKIQQLENWLDSQQIPFIIFSTVDSIPNIDFPIYHNWLVDQGIGPDQWQHFKLDGHTAWANYLTPIIDDIICKR